MKKPRIITDKERQAIIGDKTKQINSNQIIRKDGVSGIQK